MTVIRPRRNILLLSAVTLIAVLTLSCAPLLFAYAQETATTTITEEDVTDLDVVGDAMADLTEDMLEGDEVVTTIEDATAEESCDDDAAAAANADATVDATTIATATEESKADDDQQSATSEQGEEQATTTPTTTEAPPTQSGPFIDLFGDVLLSLEMVDETHAQVHQHYTNEILSGKKVVGLYFSADW